MDTTEHFLVSAGESKLNLCPLLSSIFVLVVGIYSSFESEPSIPTDHQQPTTDSQCVEEAEWVQGNLEMHTDERAQENEPPPFAAGKPKAMYPYSILAVSCAKHDGAKEARTAAAKQASGYDVQSYKIIRLPSAPPKASTLCSRSPLARLQASSLLQSQRSPRTQRLDLPSRWCSRPEHVRQKREK